MDLKTRKYSAIEKIMKMDEEALIKLEETLGLIINQEISIEEYNKEIDEADAEIEKGNFSEHEDAIKEIRSWR
jgi:predicted transcriptional regulator